MRKSRRNNECLRCRYSLTGLPPTHLCPECGLPYGPDALVWRAPVRTRFRKIVTVGGATALGLALLGLYFGATGFYKAAVACLIAPALLLGADGFTLTLANMEAYTRTACLSPHGVELESGLGKWTTVAWSDILRVEPDRTKVGIQLFCRQWVIDLVTVFHDRADAGRFIDCVRKRLSAKPAIPTATQQLG